jgi:hypothetical protein
MVEAEGNGFTLSVTELDEVTLHPVLFDTSTVYVPVFFA